MTINYRINSLRKAMELQNLDAYIIPSSDPHQSEYVADRWKSRVWISGFTGSAGTVIITKNHAGVWTDSRYFIQAEKELAKSEVVLHKQKVPHAPEHIDWLAQSLEPLSRVGCDGMLFSVAQIEALNNSLAKNNILLNYNIDLIDQIHQKRPSMPTNAVFEHDLHFAGVSRTEKIDAVREAMPPDTDFHLISTLADIAWLLNLRSSDVPCSPVFIAYAVVGRSITYLFIEAQKLPAELAKKLQEDGIYIKPYDNISSFLSELPSGKNILIDRNKTSMSLFSCIPVEQIIHGTTIPINLKAIKTSTEVKHISNAMIKDGVALTRLYRWLDETLDQRSISEVEVASKLASFRAQQKDYFGESFNAIVGYKGNGAIVHYTPHVDSCAQIKKEGMLLLDSGGQYADGTTDITRTTSLGTPSAIQKRDFTLVLKGCIALTNIQFPEGTKGIQLDVLARQYLWQHGLNYGHGTGHGVGFFLNVHEGPQGFATSIARGKMDFKPGMVTSNEPGFYKTGEYGIRIENLVLTEVVSENEFGRFLKFTTLTLFPIDLNLIEVELLDEAEKNWLNSYHKEVFEQLSPSLEEAEVAWLKEKCKPI